MARGNLLLLCRPKAPHQPPILLKYRSAKWFILTTICTAVFTDIFLYGIIVPVIPFALSQRAAVADEDIQHWVSVLLAVYGAALLAASPICGYLADKSPSRRLPLLVGLLALGGATVMLCVGSSIGILVAGRVLQGLAAAIVWTCGLALLVDTVGKKEVGHMMGYVSLSMSLAILVAPLLGGIVYAKSGYYAVYYMAFGLLAFDIIMRLLLVEKKIAKIWLDMPPTPALTPAPSATATRHTSLEASDYFSHKSLESAEPPPVMIQRKSYQRPQKFAHLPPVLTLLASPRLLAALWGCLVQGALLTAFDTVLPLRVKAVFGWNSTGAGLIFIALVIPTFIAPVLGALSDRYGPRWLVAGGFISSMPILVLLRLVDHDGIRMKVLLCALLASLGVTLTCCIVPLLAEITWVVEAQERVRPGIFGKNGAYAQAYGLFNCAFAAGTLVGPIWAGFVEQRAGWGTMSWTLGLLSAVSAIPAATWTGGFIRNRHDFHKRGEKNTPDEEIANRNRVEVETKPKASLQVEQENSRSRPETTTENPATTVKDITELGMTIHRDSETQSERYFEAQTEQPVTLGIEN